MPGLTVETSPQSQQPTQLQRSSSNSPGKSPSASPVRPPVSPITPTLRPALLATSSTSRDALPPRQTYTHSQPPQTAIPQPAPVPIAFDENPDALALKSAISILQIQARKAAEDMQTLQAMKERAMKNPEEFARAIAAGQIKSKPDSLFAPSQEDEDVDEEDDDKMELDELGKDPKAWPRIPTAQNVVRCPPINWHKYSVVGESLDKLHADQRARPTEGTPQKLGPDGKLSSGGDGQRRPADVGVAAPYQYGRDKIEKTTSRKSGKK